MYDDVPIVPNLYEAPSNPQVKDCYYNITVDKYYIYDGTEWLEAKLENDPSVANETYVVEHSVDDGTTVYSNEYSTFSALRSAVRGKSSATDVSITMMSYPAVLIPRTQNTSLDGVALLKMTVPESKKEIFILTYSKDGGNTFITEKYSSYSALIERVNSSEMEGVTDISVRMEYIGTVGKDIFTLQYSTDGGNTFIIEQYDDYDMLVNKINDPSMKNVTDIKFDMTQEAIGISDEDEIVGKIYPKVIFNQKLAENLVMNTDIINQGLFDNVLVFYKNEPKKYSYRASFKLEGQDEGIIEDFSSIIEMNKVLSDKYNYNTQQYIKEIKIEQVEK